MGEKTKKNNSYNGPFLGFNSEGELFDKLFEKSIFIFPELNINDRWRKGQSWDQIAQNYM